MPLARIRTKLNSVPPELERTLIASGYEVEAVPLQQKCSRHADLELTLESLPARVCIDESRRFDGNVYLDKGLLASPPEQPESPVLDSPPVPSQPLHPAAEPERTEETLQQADDAIRLQHEREERQRIEREQVKALLAQIAEANQAQTQADLVSQQRAEERNMHAEAEQRERERQARLQHDADSQEQLRQTDLLSLEHHLEAQRAAETRVLLENEARIRAEEQRRFEAEQARLKAEDERLRAELLRREEEFRERERQWQAERERLEQERDAAKRAPEPPPSKIIPISTARDQDQDIPVLVGSTVPQPTPADQAKAQLKQMKAALVEGGTRRLRHKEYRRAAVTAAALTAVIMMLWIALSSRRPADPLTTPDLVKANQIQQKKPFGAATIAAPVQVQQPTTSTPAPKIVTPTPEAKQSKPKPSPVKKAATSRRSRSADGSDEVVVRHFGPRTNNNASNAKISKDGVKVISDLD